MESNNEKIDNIIDQKILKKIIKMFIVEINKLSVLKLENIDLTYLYTAINDASTFDPEIDKIHLIVDRDKKSFTSKQYDNVLKKCKELNISFYVTNPCFEFWLLLHYDDCLKFDKTLLLSNEKNENGETYVFQLLKNYDESFFKNNFDAKKYVDKIEKAIKNSKNYANNIEKLKNNIGSNLNILFEEVILKRSNNNI